LQTCSFPDAELAENLPQQIVGIVFADNVADSIQGGAQIDRYQLRQPVLRDTFARSFYRLFGFSQTRLMSGADRDMRVLQ
jgi:hypothetical protein